jgi:hypothetical protein
MTDEPGGYHVPFIFRDPKVSIDGEELSVSSVRLETVNLEGPHAFSPPEFADLLRQWDLERRELVRLLKPEALAEFDKKEEELINKFLFGPDGVDGP